MKKPMSEEQIYEEASRKVKAKKGFYGSLGTYVVVNAVLIIIWALSGQGYMWFLWPLGIWGVFVLGHFLRVFVFERGSDTKAIEKEVEKMRSERP
ncbi:2TM domain-containing protein [Chloroflexota bacterium]